MGGASFGISGDLDETKISHFEEQISFFDKLMGRKPDRWPRKVESPNGDLSIELFIGDIEQQIQSDFISYLHKVIPKPWTATTALINNYLSLNLPTFHLRGQKNKRELKTSWYVQFSFTGCAGLGQVSAEICSHWIERWYQDNQQRIAKQYFLPKGFTADYQETPLDEAALFFPLAEFGYAMLCEDNNFSLNDEEITCQFDIDCSITESELIDNKKQLGKIDRLLKKYFEPEKRCYCQLCFPAFRLPKITLKKDRF